MGVLQVRRLTSITIPSGIRIIPIFAFAECVSLTDVIIEGELELIFQAAFQNCESLTSAAIPASVKMFYPDTFSGCDNLVLTVEEGSYAEKCAKSSGIPYVIAEE